MMNGRVACNRSSGFSRFNVFRRTCITSHFYLVTQSFQAVQID